MKYKRPKFIFYTIDRFIESFLVFFFFFLLFMNPYRSSLSLRNLAFVIRHWNNAKVLQTTKAGSENLDDVLIN